MTSDPIIPAPPARSLPLPFDGDLIVDFCNRDPTNFTAYLDYPSGVSGVFAIYSDRKTPGTDRISVTATPSGAHCIIKVDAAALNGVKAGTYWSFRLIYPDADLTGGYDKVVVNGLIVRADGLGS
jgi:hypothetical protein